MSKKSLPRGLGKDARSLALKAFYVQENGMTCQEALDLTLRGSEIQPREKSLASELFYGVCRNRIRLEHIAGRFLARPASLPAPMLNILHMAVYSLLELGKIPPYAAINSAVDQVAKSYGGLSRVANGYLRNVRRNIDEILNIARYDGGSFAGQAIYYSIPEYVASLWKNSYGEENALRLMRRSNKRPWSGILPTPKTSGATLQKLADLATARLDDGYCFAPGTLPEDTFSWNAKGEIFLQAPASWHILRELDAHNWKGPIWDACAGFGGKTFAMLSSGLDVQLCSDISMKRLRNLRGMCEKRGLSSPEVALLDLANSGARWPGHILVDAPCSGLGVMARRPDVARDMNDAKLASLRKIQSGILAGAARALLPGKCLAYITCTLNPAENELAIREFLAENNNLELRREWQTPHDHPELEGMYGAVLVKRD